MLHTYRLCTDSSCISSYWSKISVALYNFLFGMFVTLPFFIPGFGFHVVVIPSSILKTVGLHLDFMYILWEEVGHLKIG